MSKQERMTHANKELLFLQLADGDASIGEDAAFPEAGDSAGDGEEATA